jgi:hypothetical protein
VTMSLNGVVLSRCPDAVLNAVLNAARALGLARGAKLVMRG